MLNLNRHSSIFGFVGKDELVGVHVENRLLEEFQAKTIAFHVWL